MTDNLPPTTTTPQWVVFLVIGTLCLMALGYMATMCWMVLHGINLEDNTFVIFSTTGSGIVGALTAILVNTRVQPNNVEKK